jgi:hypothetical protein
VTGSRHPALSPLLIVPTGDPKGPDFQLVDFCIVDDVSYVRETCELWGYWSSGHAQPPPLFNWIAVYNFHVDDKCFAFCLDRSTGTSGAEALMLVTTGRVVRCDKGARPALVYVNFVEVAPWNRPGTPGRLFNGLGPILLRMACDLSIQRGYEGRVGLHSVASAEAFYRKIGFQSFDCPSEYNELYFELDAGGAQALLSD